MKMIVGLGNPGKEYQNHRHNAGFMVVDALAKRHGMEISRRSFGALVGSGVIEKEAVIIAKPMTFMNLSGDSVGGLLRFYKLEVEDLMVVHDDIDIGFGRLKLATSGGHGGHNGIRSIIDNLGESGFMRVRMGVGRPPDDVDPASFVLSNFSKDEKKIFENLVETSADAVEFIILKGLSAAQQKFH